MFLISWNVAGWSATSAAIRESYGSLQHFFELTGADIICIQECKGTWAKLEADTVGMGASDLRMKKRKQIQPVPRFHATSLTTSAGDASTHTSRGMEGRGPPVSSTCSTPSTGTGSTSLASTGGVDGWESFWAFSGPTHRGFNGVVTFAKKGLTWRCDNAPFVEPEFNDEGRVVVTHHSEFVIVNVYVPNARGGERLAFKFRFLESLKSLLGRLRADTGKPVILLGDLNMTYRPEDASWSLQRIHLRELIALNAEAAKMAASPPSPNEESWDEKYPHMPQATLKRLTNGITHVLCDQLAEIMSTRTMQPSDQSTGQQRHTSGPLQSVEGETSFPLLTRTLNSEEVKASSSSTPMGTSVVSVDTPIVSHPTEEENEGIFRMSVAVQLQTAIQAKRQSAVASGLGAAGVGPGGANYSEPPVSLDALYACGFRSVFVDELVSNVQPSHNRDVYALTKLCGLPPHGQESVRYMASLLHEEGRWRCDVDVDTDPLMAFAETEEMMWDTFRIGRSAHEENASYCPCPYTCWDQSRNRRLTNVGTRLDYILVDSVLAPFVVPRGHTANNTGFSLKPAGVAPVQPQAADAKAAASVYLPRAVVSAQTPVGEEPDAFFANFSGAARTDSIRRTMADGLYPSAPYDGAGLPPLEDGARGCAFCDLPATGLFVTPPQFSDHIGVGVVFKSGTGGLTLEPRPGKLVEDHGKCMYRPPVGLQSFFMRAAAATREAPKPTEVKSEEVSDRPQLHTAERIDTSLPPKKAVKTEQAAPKKCADVIDVDSDDEVC